MCVMVLFNGTELWLRRRLEEKRCAHIVSILRAKKGIYSLKIYYHRKVKDSTLSDEDVSSDSFYVASLFELLMIVC